MSNGFFGAALTRLAKCIGPYRIWRAFHRMAEVDRVFANSLLSYVAEAELPDKVLEGHVVERYLDDRTIVDAVRKRSEFQDSPFYAHHVYAECSRILEKHNRRASSILEVGPGAHLGALTCFAVDEARKVAAVDAHRVDVEDDTFIALMKDYLACVGGFQWWRYYAAVDERPEAAYPYSWEHTAIRDVVNRIDYRAPCDAAELPFEEGSFDFVYSIAVLEHLEHVVDAIKEIHRVLVPGGLTVHEVDLRHHGSSDPLKFLRWTEEEYRERAKKYGPERGLDDILRGDWAGEVYCNRLRLSDFMDMFEQLKFNVLDVEPLCTWSESAIARDEFVEPFRSRPLSDLAVLQFRITAEKL